VSATNGDEHDAAWDAIARSPLLSVYVHELHWLASDVVRRADAIFEQTPPPDPESDYIKVEPGLHSEIYAMLADAAKIRALITERPKRRDQSRMKHEILVRRARSLRGLLSGLDAATVCSADARHSVEHFDERIDAAAIGAYERAIVLPVNIPLDLAVWSRGVFEVLKGTTEPPPTIYPLRVYVASERRFLNGDVEIEVGALRDECAAIRDRLAPAMHDPNERGGFVVVVTEQSFDGNEAT
jgi:hypothetical protein